VEFVTFSDTAPGSTPFPNQENCDLSKTRSATEQERIKKQIKEREKTTFACRRRFLFDP